MTTLPADLGITIAKKMATNASGLETRAAWLDGLVEIQITSKPQPTESAAVISLQYVVNRFPRINKDRLQRLIEEMTVSKISDIDKATLLAYCMYNADQLNSVEENLNFTSSARILAVWPRLVSSREDAEKLVGKPSDLANVIYGSNSAIGKSLGNQYP